LIKESWKKCVSTKN